MYIASEYVWMTHQPLIRAVMECYKPKFVLELGVGIYSTPLFKEYDIEYLGIDNDKEWVDKIKDDFGVNILYHNLGEITDDKGYDELSEKQKEDIISYYNNLVLSEINPSLLFVDQFASCRVLSINTLRDKFDLIIYHDSTFLTSNRYDLINDKGFNVYILKTDGACTELMTKKDIDISETIKLHIEKFKNEHQDCTLMEYYGLDSRK